MTTKPDTAEIYKITNTVNNKVYIGQVSSYTKDGRTRGTIMRWKEHLRASKRTSKKINHLYSAIKLYGEDKFKVEILECVERSAVDSKECYYIEQFNSRNGDFGYNIREGGHRPYPSRPEAVKQWENPEYREKMVSKVKKQWEDPEFAAKVSKGVGKAAVERWKDPATRARLKKGISEAHRKLSGRTHLPMYVQERKYKGAMAGYIVNLPDDTHRSFTCSKLSLDEKLALAKKHADDWIAAHPEW